MKWILVVAVFLAMLTLSMADGDVVNLTDGNFEAYLKNSSVMMVKFYAPWCGHCKQFAPKYEKAATLLKQQNKPYVLGELDATVNKETAAKFKVQGYPTIKLFIEGSPIDYDADRTAEAVITFINKKTSPPSTELKSVEEVKAQKDGKGLRVHPFLFILIVHYCCIK
jgi:protein disulfide-isomerase-like protein